MKEKNNLVKIFSGREVSVIILKGKLEEQGISSIIQNDYQSGITAGFMGGTTSSIELYIQESDLNNAEPIINEFIKNNEQILFTELSINNALIIEALCYVHKIDFNNVQ